MILHGLVCVFVFRLMLAGFCGYVICWWFVVYLFWLLTVCLYWLCAFVGILWFSITGVCLFWIVPMFGLMVVDCCNLFFGFVCAELVCFECCLLDVWLLWLVLFWVVNSVGILFWFAMCLLVVWVIRLFECILFIGCYCCLCCFTICLGVLA